jgi:hypothetical protein
MEEGRGPLAWRRWPSEPSAVSRHASMIAALLQDATFATLGGDEQDH